MKKMILFFLIAGTVSATGAQSLKDALYSGKLKMDSNSVIRKGDDLSARLDTSTKKAAAPEKPKQITAATDSATARVAATGGDSAVAAAPEAVDSATTAEPVVTETAVPVKSNTRLLKEYTDSLAGVLKTEVLSSKKIKKETYYLIVEYEIDTNGQTTVTNVISTPENSLLQEQVKERMLLAPPQLAPALDSNKQPRKVKRKYSFTVTKE